LLKPVSYLALLLAWAPLLAAEVRLAQPDGGVLSLPEPAQRIITLAPHLAEGVYAAGAGGQLVATVEYSEYPATAADLQRIGDAFRLDIERIVALRPDLVIAWGSGNPRPAVEQLRALGLAVWSVEIREPGSIPTFIEDVGRASGHRSEAESEATRLRLQLHELEQRYAAAEPVRYFYQVDAKPLFTINGQHLISRGLALCGGSNIFAGEPGQSRGHAGAAPARRSRSAVGLERLARPRGRATRCAVPACSGRNQPRHAALPELAGRSV